MSILHGAVWTTDAPFRQTAEAIAAAGADGLLALEMEAAALYAFASARRVPVICLAHLTNRMAQVEGDFEKRHRRQQGRADRLVLYFSLLAR